MTTLALMHLLTAAKKTTSGGSAFILPLLLVAFGGFYFFFLRPQQKKAAAARAGVGTSGYEVGDEVQTIGGIIGTVLEINGDKYTLLTGATDSAGNIDGLQPTRIVFVRQAIARKVERVVDVDPEDHSEIDDHDHDHDHNHEEEETEET